MLDMEYSGFGVNIMPAYALAPKVASVGQTTYIVVPELISSALVKPNPRHDLKCEYIFNIL